MPKLQKSNKIDQKLTETTQIVDQKLTETPLDENLFNKMSKDDKKAPKLSKTDKQPVNDITGFDEVPFRPESILEEKFEKVLAERKKRPRAPSPSYDSATRSRLIKASKAGPKLLIDPSELGDEYYNKIRQLASSGLSQRQIAAYLGMHETTWYQNCQKYPEIRIAVKQGCARAVEALAKNAYKRAIEGDTTLTIFLMKTIGRFSESWKHDENGDEEPATPSLAITVIDPIEAMRQYEKIMKD